MEPLVEVGSTIQDVTATATEELKKLAKEILPKVPKLIPILSEGISYSEILSLAEEHHADLLIVASHARGGIDRLIFGSTTEKLLSKSACPVLIVHPAEREFVKESNSEIELKHIMAGIDFTACSDLALGYALDLARQYKSALTVVHVHEGKDDPSEESIKSVAHVKQRIDNALQREDGYTPRGEVVVLTGKPDKELIRFADDHEIDLIVIGSRSHGLLRDLFFSSDSEKIARSAPCPVLSICEGSPNPEEKEE
jgi:nucleotide-binding universal stress UspA family protein